MERLVLTIAEAAEVIGVGRTKMFEMLAAGDLPVVRLGRIVRIPKRELEDWLRDRTEGGLTTGVDSSRISAHKVSR